MGSNKNQSNQEFMPFDSYEIYGCRDYGGFVEQVSDGELPQFWCLFGHVTGKGLFSIGDFDTRSEAEEIQQRIEGALPFLK